MVFSLFISHVHDIIKLKTLLYHSYTWQNKNNGVWHANRDSSLRCVYMSLRVTVWTNNINWRDVQRKNVVNNVDKSSLRAPWQNGPYTQNDTKTRRTPYCNRHLENKTIFCIFPIFLFYLLFHLYFLNEITKKCWVIALVGSMTFIGNLNQFQAITNLTLSQHCFREEKEKYAFTLSNQAS